MKIAILTQPLRANYGGILQNYALQQVLIKLEHSPITLEKDFHQYISPLRLLFEFPKRIFTKFVLKKRSHIFSERACNKWIDSLYFDKLTQFIQNNIEHSYVVNFNSFNFEYYNGYIVGSDQVWRPIFNIGLLDTMFLSFLPKNASVKKIAYAASFGTDEWEYSDEQTAAYQELAQRFDAISVREDSGVVLCKNHLRIDAIHVLDPTLLLDKEHYNKLCIDIPSEKGYLYAYILDQTAEDKIRLEEFAKSKGLKLKICSADSSCTLTMEQWIAMFRDAEMVITNSFHGIIFSIIFNKEFYSLTHTDRGSGRIPSLFRQLGIPQSRIVSDIQNIPDRDSAPLDWDTTKKRINELQQHSIAFLRHALASKL